MSSRPWYRWFPGDYLQDTLTLSIEADCLYRRLLDAHWNLGYLPSDEDDLMRLARFPAPVFKSAWREVERYFYNPGGRGNRLYNKKLKALLASTSRSQQQKREAANARWNNKLHADAMQTQCDPDPDPEEEKKEEDPPSVSSPRSDLRFSEWWSAYPNKTGKKACLTIWKRRKLDKHAERLINDVKNRKGRDVKWADGFVPNPQTYLNGDRWEDEIKTTRSNGNGGNGHDRHETRCARDERKLREWYDRETAGRVDPGEADGVLVGDATPVRPKVDG